MSVVFVNSKSAIVIGQKNLISTMTDMQIILRTEPKPPFTAPAYRHIIIIDMQKHITDKYFSPSKNNITQRSAAKTSDGNTVTHLSGMIIEITSINSFVLGSAFIIEVLFPVNIDYPLRQFLLFQSVFLQSSIRKVRL